MSHKQESREEVPGIQRERHSNIFVLDFKLALHEDDCFSFCAFGTNIDTYRADFRFS
jgi:hypothetical protein